MKLFLIGFMGSGKSHIGKQLAQLLDYLFIDTDHLLENTEGSSVAQIFETRGEVAFRQLESDTLKGLSKWDNIVVATGGGAPCFHDSMDWMNENGITVYLKTSPALLMERLKSEAAHRPILGGRTDDDLLHFIEQKSEERNPFYSQATLTIEQEGNGEEMVGYIVNALYERVSAN